jgi:putative alpha-1,2-mannosidase
MLIGCPKFARTVLRLAGGGTLVIRREGAYAAPVSARFNGKLCRSLQLAASELMNGGELVICTETAEE